MIYVENKYEALWMAVEKGHLNCLKYLHENGGDITAIDHDALYWAVENGYEDCVQYIKQVTS
jgi:hypothetical protein